MKGLFNISNFDNAGSEDILDLKLNTIFENSGTASDSLLDEPITEGDEFASGSPADPEKHFNADNSGNRSIPVPNDETLDEDTYNKALDALQKSFKEGVEVLEALKKYQESSDNIEAIFEEVNRSDKEEVRKIRNKLKGKVLGYLEDQDVSTSEWSFIRSLLIRETALYEWWTTRFWQVIGLCYTEPGGVNELTRELTDKFKDDLKGYKINAVRVVPDLWDAIKLKLGWKNQKWSYMLVIDKKRSNEK